MDAVIGTAGWTIPRQNAAAFPAEGTALERYSQVFGGVEVNSSFHRAHRTSTWARWAASVPDRFRFAVKIPKTITHQAKLTDAERLIAQFAQEVAPLGAKLAVLLVQLPPKLAFDARVAERFFASLRGSIDAGIVCEPRNASWFADEADSMLRQARVARAAADPALGTAAAVPGGWRGWPIGDFTDRPRCTAPPTARPRSTIMRAGFGPLSRQGSTPGACLTTPRLRQRRAMRCR